MNVLFISLSNHPAQMTVNLQCMAQTRKCHSPFGRRAGQKEARKRFNLVHYPAPCREKLVCYQKRSESPAVVSLVATWLCKINHRESGLMFLRNVTFMRQMPAGAARAGAPPKKRTPKSPFDASGPF
ncbi:hypothetical protein JOD97_005784 [Duganella sp. 1411]|uniref:hypothetical protein n=1 Tax=Duganella sp. 1411 TaxID=2806572 RepID=UPI001AE7B835|nr:hypothetical protein [Duganella sp. 1411]MBP1207701.1 hypothetical protein [Duganella sp. 1411]